MSKRLQILLYVIAVYLVIFGGLFVLAPSEAARITKTTHDPSLDLLYGMYALVFAYAAFYGAREKRADSRLPSVILLLLLGHVIVFGYLLVTGHQRFAQAGAPIIVNALLATLLIWSMEKDTGKIMGRK